MYSYRNYLIRAWQWLLPYADISSASNYHNGKSISWSWSSHCIGTYTYVHTDKVSMQNSKTVQNS